MVKPERGKGVEEGREAAFPLDGPVTDSLGQSREAGPAQPSQEVAAAATAV